MIKPLDIGTLCITDKRFIFNGPLKTISPNLSKIMKIQADHTGFSLLREGKKKTEYYMGIDNSMVFQIIVEGRKHQIILTKEMVVTAILNLVSKL